MRALALDFDGVIADSAPEAYRVARQAFRAVFGAEFPELARTKASAVGDDHDGDGDEAVDAALYAGFLELMPLGNRAEDYGAALLALARGETIGDQRAYDAFFASLPKEKLRAFHECFYRARRAFFERDPEAWFARVQPYPGMCALLRRAAAHTQLAVATAKDRASVHLLLARYGVADLFPRALIHDKETGVSKCAHIRAIARTLDCAPREVTFVDDKVNHLESVAPLGARCVLATWGYNGARELQRAQAAGFATPTLAELPSLLFAPAPPAQSSARAAKLLP